MAEAKNSAVVYFRKQNKEGLEALTHYAHAHLPESLHKLRVALKKVKAVLCLLTLADNDFKLKKEYAPYKKLFDQSGDIREEHLLRDSLKTVSEQLAKKSEAKLGKLNRRFEKNAAAHRSGLLQKSISLIPFFEKIKPGHVKKFCFRQWKRARKIAKDAKGDAALHELRKELKLLLYCSSLLSKAELEKHFTSKRLKRVDALQNAIGQLHDKVMLLKALKAESDVSRVLIKNLKAERNNRRKKAKGQLTKLFK